MNKYQKKHRFKNIILSVFTAFLALFMCLSVQAGTYINASAAELSGYDSTDVVTDLEGMEIDGEAFDISDYAPNDYTQTDVLVFAEYKFPTYIANIDSFELYVYVWNPQRISYELRSELNYVELGISADGEYTAYNKYQLKYLDVSDESGYSGVFIKYKVVLSDSQKQEFYNTFTGEERYYHVAGLELLVSGETNATDYDINKEYIYSGYAAGCGADSEAESTLSFYQDVGTTLNLDVNSTVYRPEGNNGVNDYTQDSLHSVYFSVPNDVLSEYGELYGVHASWLNAVLAPTLVIKQSVLDEYDALEEQLYNNLGKDISEDYDNTEYAIVALKLNGLATGEYPGRDCLGYYFWYNKPSDSSTLYIYNPPIYINSGLAGSKVDNYYNSTTPLNMADVSLNTLNMYLAVDTDDLSSYIVPTGTLQARMLELTNSVYSTDSKVAGKYAASLFSSVDSEYTEVNITAEDSFSLTDYTYKGFWSGLWARITGGSVKDYSEGESINALYAVQASDMTGTDEEICENLKIGAGDIDDFKAYYEEATANGETVYLFRYQQSDYEAIEGTIFDRNSSNRNKWYEVSGTNCYFFQETVNLDFDIIDVTFRGEDMKLTTLAVISNPIDVIAEPTAPIGMTDGVSAPWWVYLIIVLAELVVLIVLWFILCKLCGVPGWVLFIILVILVVIDVFCIQSVAVWLYSLF